MTQTTPRPARTQEIAVSVAGAVRRFTLQKLTVAQSLAYMQTQERIVAAVQAVRVETENDAALRATLYLDGIASILATVVLTTPADDGPPLTAADVFAFDGDEPMRVLATFEDFAGITELYVKGQEMAKQARDAQARQLRAEAQQAGAKAPAETPTP